MPKTTEDLLSALRSLEDEALDVTLARMGADDDQAAYYKQASVLVDTLQEKGLPDHAMAVVIKHAGESHRYFPVVDPRTAALAAHKIEALGELPSDTLKHASAVIGRFIQYNPSVKSASVHDAEAASLDEALAGLMPSSRGDLDRLYAERALSQMEPAELRAVAKHAGANNIAELQDFSGDRFGPHFAGQLLDRRFAHRADPIASSVLTEFSEKVASGQISPDDAAEFLEEFDKARPTEGVLPPYQAVFMGTADDAVQKVASMSKEALLSKLDRIREEYGDMVAEKLQARPVEVYDSLPDDMKERIQAM